MILGYPFTCSKTIYFLGNAVIQKHNIEKIEWSEVEDLFNMQVNYNLKSWSFSDVEKMHNSTCELVQKWRRVIDSQSQMKQLKTNLELIQVALGISTHLFLNSD